MAEDTLFAEQTAPLSFAEFLERMKDPAAADLVRSIKNFIKTFDDRTPDPERDALSVQSFLVKSEAAFKQHPVWASVPPIHQAQAVEGLEKYLMTKIYHKVFAVSELDRERDESLTMRMSALGFIEPKHLDIPETYHDEKSWILARKELHKINNYKAPRDKLVCVLNCCRVINNLLHVQVQGEARGADDFLPVLIYVVIHANPPQLASNLEYIQRFRMHSRMASESAYFFTQLYSAASFIETVNANSLTIDPDEFMARMVAAGVPDMQLAPYSNAPSLTGRTSNTSLAGALGNSTKPAPLVGPGLAATEPATQLQQSAAALAQQALAPVAPQEAASLPGITFAGIPAGAALPTSAVPLPGGAFAGMLPTHSGALGIPDVQAQLPIADPIQWVAPTVPAPGESALVDPTAAPSVSTLPALQQPGGLAAPGEAPVVGTGAEATASEGPLPLTSHFAAAVPPQGTPYPPVADLEVAGTELVLGAEASGRLKEQHTFLYAMAADLRVVDISKLLTEYKELVLRYEALSLAVSQLHTQSQQLQQSSQSLASAHGQGVPAEIQQQQQSPYTVGTGRDSPSHLLASRQPEKAHEPMFGAAQPGTEPAQGPATAALLQEASDTAHEAAEAVLAPQTSARFYDEEEDPETTAEAHPSNSSTAVAEQSQPVTDDDRFLSLATGETQADAPDVAKAPSMADTSAAQPQPESIDENMGQHANLSGGAPEPIVQPAVEAEASHESSQAARAGLVEMPAAESYAADDEASIGTLGSLPGLPMPMPHRISGRQSISSTAATIADDDAESLAARPSSSPEQVSSVTADAAASSAADSLEGSKSARVAYVQAQPDVVPESGVSSTPSNGSKHGAATSNDYDPFAETDAALHSTALPQREQEDVARTQDDGDNTSGGQKASGEAQQDLFGGLTLSAAAAVDKSLI